MRALSRLAYAIGRPAPYDHLIPYAKKVGRFFSDRLRDVEVDAVFAPGGVEGVAYLETDLPVIMYSDATWERIVDYHRAYSNLAPFVFRSGEEIESRAILRSDLLLYSSTWAADSAIEHYGADPDRVIIPFIGANFLDPPTREEILPRTIGEGPVRLLMVGVNWFNKGGAIARQVLEGLLERGIDATLTVAGCTVPEEERHPAMTVVPFLNKGIPEERARFRALWSDADFFILPSRFEAAGLVFCEASAFGLPILAARTGGIPSIVRDGANGFTIPHAAEPDGYIDHILELRSDPDAYTRLAESARAEYETRLNWEVWGRTVMERVRGVVG